MNLDVLWYICCRLCVLGCLFEIIRGDWSGAFVVAASGLAFFLLGRREEMSRDKDFRA